MLKKLAVVLFALLPFAAGAQGTQAEPVHMKKPGRMLTINSLQEHAVLVRATVNVLKLNGWEEGETASQELPVTQPWCKAVIGQGGYLVRGECYSPHDGYGVDVRDMTAVYDYEKNAIDLSGVPVMIEKIYTAAARAQEILAIPGNVPTKSN